MRWSHGVCLLWFYLVHSLENAASRWSLVFIIYFLSFYIFPSHIVCLQMFIFNLLVVVYWNALDSKLMLLLHYYTDVITLENSSKNLADIFSCCLLWLVESFHCGWKQENWSEQSRSPSLPNSCADMKACVTEKSEEVCFHCELLYPQVL